MEGDSKIDQNLHNVSYFRWISALHVLIKSRSGYKNLETN